MSDNSPSCHTDRVSAADSHLRHEFPLRKANNVGACLRVAFDHQDREDAVPDELTRLMKALNQDNALSDC